MPTGVAAAWPATYDDLVVVQGYSKYHAPTWGAISQVCSITYRNEPPATPEHAARGVGFTAINDLLAVVAIIDPTEVQGFNWAQVADYVAMTGLTRVAPDVNVRDTPSILQLFTAATGSRPAGLSDWDRSFLKDLYGTDPGRRGQRFEVSRLMVRDLQLNSTTHSQ